MKQSTFSECTSSAYSVHVVLIYCIYLRNFHTFLANFLVKKGGVKIVRGSFGRRCYRGDFEVRSKIRYPIHKLEIKCFGLIIQA
jgi:hypothetical protein